MDNSDVSHDGHRARLLETAVNGSLDILSEIQQVEFMLTYIFPRGDVNPLAHRLLDAYGSLGGILDADFYTLKGIKGINDRSAKKNCHVRRVILHLHNLQNDQTTSF